MIKNYVVTKTLGTGSVGIVYESVDPMTQRPVVIKLAKGPLDKQQHREWIREAEILARLKPENPSDPNGRHVVAYVEHGVDQGRPFLVMEYHKGESLRHLLRHGRMPWRRACRLVAQAARGTHWLHKQLKAPHNDIKPENLLVTKDELVKVLDFGLCPGMKETGSLLQRWQLWLSQNSAVSQTRGTPPYADLWEDAGPAADIYSLGAVLFECLTDRLLDTNLEMYRNTGSLLTQQWGIEVPLQVKAICMSALVPPDLRPSAERMALDLENAANMRDSAPESIGKTEQSGSRGRRHGVMGIWALPKPMVWAVAGLILLTAGTVTVRSLTNGSVVSKERSEDENENDKGTVHEMAKPGANGSSDVTRDHSSPPATRPAPIEGLRSDSAGTLPEKKDREPSVLGKAEALAEALKVTALKFKDEPIKVSKSTVDSIAEIDEGRIKDLALKSFASVADGILSGLMFEVHMGTSSGFYKKTEDYALFVSKHAGSGIGFPDKMPDYVLFFPVDGSEPSLLVPFKVEGGYGVVGASRGVYAVPR
jgi:serine/threonine protein kinase